MNPSPTPRPEPASTTNPQQLQRQVKRRLEYLEGLENQILQAQNDLESLDNQVRAARVRKDNIVAELQAESKRRQQAETAKLAERTAVLERNIQALTNEKTRLEADVLIVQTSLDKAQADRNIVKQELSEVHEALLAKDQQLRDVDRAATAREQEALQLVSQVEELQGTIAELHENTITIEKENEALLNEFHVKQADLAEDIAQLNIKKDQTEQRLKEVEDTITVRTKQLNEVAAKDEMMRRSLAEERLRLDKLDKNLRVREMTVRQGEDKLVQNSQLLGL